MADGGGSIVWRASIGGAEDSRRSLSTIAQAGQDAAAAIASSFEKSGGVADAQLAKYRRMGETLQSLARQRDAQASFNSYTAPGLSGPSKSASDSASVFEEQARATEDLEKRSTALRATLDPLFAAETRRNAELKEAGDLLRAGAISEATHTAAVARSEAAYKRVLDASTKTGKSIGLNSMQIAELGAVARHSFDALAAGASPMTVLAQHAATTGQALGSGEGGVAGSLGAIGRLAGAWVPLIAGGVVLAGLTVAAMDYAKAQHEIAVALETTGAASGATSQQINAIAEASSAAGKASVSQGRDIAVGLLETGKVGAESLKPATDAVAAFIKLTGSDAKTALQLFGPAFADPAKGAQDLGEKLHVVDDATARYIERLVSLGNEERARIVLADAVKKNLDDTRSHVNQLGDAVDWLKKKWDGMWTAAGRALDRAVHGPDLAQRAIALQAEKAAALRGENSYQEPGGVARYAVRDQATIDRELRQVAADQKAGEARSKADADRDATLKAGTLARKQSGGDELDELRTQQSTLKAGLDAAGRGTAKVADLAGLRSQYEATTRAVNTWIPAAEKARRLDDLDAQAAATKSPAKKAQIAAERERLEQSGKIVSAADVEAQAASKASKAKDGATHSSEGHAKALARESASLTANAEGALAAADAYLRSSAEGMRADAQRTAATAAAKNGADLQRRTEEQLVLSVAQGAETGAKSLKTLEDQTEARSKLTDAVQRGDMTSAEAEKVLQREQVLRPLVALQVFAHGRELTVLTAIIERYRAALSHATDEDERSAAAKAQQASATRIAQIAQEARIATFAPNDPRRQAAVREGALAEGRTSGLKGDALTQHGDQAVAEDQAKNSADASTYAAQTTREYDRQRVVLQAQIAMAGVSAGQRAVLLADLRAQQVLEDHHIDVTSADGQRLLAQVRDQELLNQSLERANAGYEEIRGQGDRLLDVTGTLFTNMDQGWDSVLSTGLSALKELESEMFKLALINPWKNALLGENNPTLSSVGGFSGFFSKLFGGGTPAAGAGGFGGFGLGSGDLDPGLSNSIGLPSWLLNVSGATAHSTGSEDATPGWRLVGEHGPELERGRGGDRIETASRTSQMLDALSRGQAAAPIIVSPNVAGGSQGGGGGVVVNDYRTTASPPIERKRDSQGNTHFNIYDTAKKGMDSYVRGGDFERAAKSTTSNVTARA